MTTISHPSGLTLTTDVVINTSTQTIQLVTTGAISNAGSTGGVTGQALYSFLKQQWASNATFIKFPFPMNAITPEQFEFVNGWLPADNTTRNLLRNAGWAEYSSAGVLQQKYMGVISLGTIGGSDQPYYNWGTGSATNFAFAGPINQAVQIYGDSSHGNFDYTSGSTTFNVYVRTQGKTYASSNNTSIGASTLTYNVQRFPLSNATDLNVATADSVIASTSPWNQITVNFYSTPQSRNIDGTSQPFSIIINDASGVATPQQIYEKIQWSLRQTSNINALGGGSTVIGQTAAALLVFVGQTLEDAENGVAIDGLNTNYKNSVIFLDNNGVTRAYPFIAAGTINFGSNATSGDFKYWMFYTTNPTGNFGSSTAVLVNDSTGTPIEGTYAGSPITFSYAYDTNTDGGKTAGTSPSVTLVGIGTTTGQYTEVTYTITRAAGQSILLAPALERNYTT